MMLAPHSHMHPALESYQIGLCLFQHQKHLSVKWAANELSIVPHIVVWLSTAPQHLCYHPCWGKWLLIMDVCGKWGPFSTSNLPSMSNLPPLFSYRQDKKQSYSPYFGSTTNPLVFVHSPSQVQFTPTLTWPEVNDCSRITSFQSKYIPATQQGLLI